MFDVPAVGITRSERICATTDIASAVSVVVAVPVSAVRATLEAAHAVPDVALTFRRTELGSQGSGWIIADARVPRDALPSCLAELSRRSPSSNDRDGRGLHRRRVAKEI